MPRNNRKRNSVNRSSVRSKRRNTGSHAQLLSESLPLELSPEQEIASAWLAKPTTHPNVFRKRIRNLEGRPHVASWVRLYSMDEHEIEGESASANASRGEGRLFAYGIYNPKSEIAVRIVRWSEELPDRRFWEQLLDRAVDLRCNTLNLNESCDCYRVLHAEADGFPGLVVDRYGECLSAEVFSAGMIPRVEEVVARLAQRLGTQHWLIQPGPHLQSQEGFDFRPYASDKLPKQVIVHEGSVRFAVNFENSHKTGFFCDQRENRKRLGELCRGKSVLDVCCYTGGFAITAAKRGAAQVIGVDLDESPLETAKRNAKLNQVQVKFTQADAFPFMRDLLRNGKQFEVVVLDPPKLIRNRSELDEGTRRHFDLNRLAMQLVEPGGLMLTCSCAGLLPTHEFTRLVRAAARSAFQPSELNPKPIARSMQILSSGGAAACHPVSANCPETEYFKGMWLRL